MCLATNAVNQISWFEDVNNPDVFLCVYSIIENVIIIDK